MYDGPYGTLHTWFQPEIPVDAAHRGLEQARSMDAAHVAIWSATDVERPELDEVGLEVGSQPWWTGRAIAGVCDESMWLARRGAVGPRPAAGAGAQPLLDRNDVFCVVARADGRYGGHA